MQTDAAAKCARVLADFAGKWQLNRQIIPDKGPKAVFEGHADWVWSKGRLLNDERGTLTIKGQTPMQAERRYVWASDLSVFFEDGRFFHQVPSLGGQTEHWCDPDRYVVSYDFSQWPQFDVKWQVRGPKKAYQMISTYKQG